MAEGARCKERRRDVLQVRRRMCPFLGLQRARMLEQVAGWLLMMSDASACPQGSGGRNYLRLSVFGMERTLQQGLFVEFQNI